MMGEMIAFCGLDCARCDAFQATLADDDEARRRIAAAWSDPEAGYGLSPEDIVCDGCLVQDGRVMSFCRDCPIRQCGLSRGVENCAHCDEYPCARLRPCHERSPQAREALQRIRESL
ncbi:MAG: DUF3795 domain-containing protein [Candidatus Brocadiaceae bacterium]|jgi:hypothetical protein